MKIVKLVMKEQSTKEILYFFHTYKRCDNCLSKII